VASDDEEALRLNTLHRFSKHSQRLLLQEYSSCEVPAGCGGVVLRWIEREGGLPVILRMAALGPIRCWLDEVELNSSTTTLHPGEHVLALEVSELTRANTPLAVRLDVNLPNDSTTLLRSTLDAGWWCTYASPSGDWRALAYNPTDPQRGQDWSRVRAHLDHESYLPQDQRWRWSSLTRESQSDRPGTPGAGLPLALAGTHAWLRCVFAVDAARVAGHLAEAEARARGE
jgi:hypothetical protein